MRDFQQPGRSAAIATGGMAATSHPLATLTAIDVLRAGGNAIDAAVAAGAMLAVVEPHMTGIGGDCFVLYAPSGGDNVIAMNGSGRAPAGLTLERVLADAPDGSGIGPSSPHSVSIPGAIDAWARLVADHGSKELGALLQPAIEAAENGYSILGRVASDWATETEKLGADADTAQVFLPGGAAPAEGDVHRQPQLAATLRRVAKKGRAGFYEGATAETMASFLRSRGATHRAEDFAANKPDYVTPIRTRYCGVDIYQCPPNTQGITALEMMNILSGYDPGDFDPLHPDWLHLQIEAGRLAYRDRDAFLADPEKAKLPIEHLLSAEYAASLRAQIRLDRAMVDLPPPGKAEPHTVYLTVVDKDRNAVSFINSLFEHFGSGIFCPKTGVMFQNRATLFSVDPDHPNCVAPGKRPFHTIIPGMAVRNGRTIMSFGVMGGHYQPFGHVHLISSVFGFGLDPQAALDLPRVSHDGVVLEAEQGIPETTRFALQAKGHDVALVDYPHGGGQAIRIDWERGTLVGGSDPRKDGCAIGY
jgi:gamma-glutamyltranspeptidase / glutathione hydrolase